MRPYGEVLNDIRADKNVSISAIEQFGISKSRWYRFVAGEAELSLKELIDVVNHDLFRIGHGSQSTIVSAV